MPRCFGPLLLLISFLLASSAQAQQNVYIILEQQADGQTSSEALDSGHFFDAHDPFLLYKIANHPTDPDVAQILWQASDQPIVWRAKGDNDFRLVEHAVLPVGAEIEYRFIAERLGTEIQALRQVQTAEPWGFNHVILDLVPNGTFTVEALLRVPGRPIAKVSQKVQVVNSAIPWPTPESPESPSVGTGGGTDQGGDDKGALPPPNGPEVGDNGFTKPAATADGQIIYVSDSTGKDTNNGLSPTTAVKTLARGAELLRNGKPDWLLLKAGDTWRDQALTNFNKSGRSPAEPMVIGAYGEGGRPTIIPPHGEHGFHLTDHYVDGLVIQGLRFYAETRNPASPRYVGRPGDIIGIRVRINATEGKYIKRVVIEDCAVSYFDKNIEVVDDWARQQGEGVPGRVAADIRRNIVRFATSEGSHSVGIYLEGTRDTTVEQNLVDHNGWAPTEGNETRNKRSHNIYAQSFNGPIIVRENIITRGAAHGLQLRAGGIVERNLFYRNAAAFYCSRNDSKALYNVVLESTDMDPTDSGFFLGYGIEGWGMNRYELEGNLVARRVGTVQKAGIEAFADNLIIKNNLIYEWSTRDGQAIVYEGDNVTIAGNHLDEQDGVRVVYTNPERGLDDYAMHLLLPVDTGDELLDLIAERGRGLWYDQASAEGINDYIRDGFHVKEVIELDPPSDPALLDINLNLFGLGVSTSL